MLLTCKCGTTNRIPSLPKGKVRCGKCKIDFGPAELARARPEDPPKKTEFGGALDDAEEDEDLLECKCGWEGTEDEADADDNNHPRCPDCNKKLKTQRTLMAPEIVIDAGSYGGRFPGDDHPALEDDYARYLDDVLDPRD